MREIADSVVPVAEALEQAGVPYAFGGAIAYAYYGQPRATTDIAINIFLVETESHTTLTALASLGVQVDLVANAERIKHTGQIRLRWDQILVDLFFMNVDFLESARDRVRIEPYEGRDISVLSGEDLAVCKTVFNRPKDWFDLEAMVRIQSSRLDLPYIRHWLAEILGADDARIVRFETLVSAYIS